MGGAEVAVEGGVDRFELIGCLVERLGRSDDRVRVLRKGRGREEKRESKKKARDHARCPIASETLRTTRLVWPFDGFVPRLTDPAAQISSLHLEIRQPIHLVCG